MANPKLLIIGHARHGKDTVAEILRDTHGYDFVSSSGMRGEPSATTRSKKCSLTG